MFYANVDNMVMVAATVWKVRSSPEPLVYPAAD